VTLVLREEDVRAALADVAGAVDAVADGVREAGRAGGDPPRRMHLALQGGWLRLMGGALPESDLLGFKSFHLVDGGVRYLCGVYRLSTGEPLGLLDARELTLTRTGAAAAAAARRYFGGAPVAVGVFGAGTYARSGLRILAAACNVRSVRVFSPRRESRTSFAAELGAELGTAVEPVSEPAEVGAGADMLLCCTDTGGYVSSVGSTLPAQRELSAAAVGAAGLVVVDSAQALEESGDLIAATQRNHLPARVSLLSAFLESGPGPDAAAQLTVYKSVGSFEQDLALAGFVLRECARRGLGEEVAAVESLRPPR
jgi:ornithine cyclodeaminase/alanine dehydrogenase-like protein (mu-crystallin family)